MNSKSDSKKARISIAGLLWLALISATHAQNDRPAPFNHPRAHAAALSAPALNELLATGATQILFVDVRKEFAEDQHHALLAKFVRIPYYGENTTKLNTQFPLAVGNALAAKGLSIGAVIVFICTDGASSAEAAKWLAWAGHTNVVFAQGGVNELVVAQQAASPVATQIPEMPTAQNFYFLPTTATKDFSFYFKRS
jgi:rhodanese-related sulfurtransferase